MAYYIVEQDIVTMKTDAIVNAANTRLAPGSGVCGAIFRAAGFEKLYEACAKIGFCETGKAVITPGFDLCPHIIHTPGPIWLDGQHGEEALLRDCYRNSIALAANNHCESIAFPLISAGIYGYPFEDALRVARKTIVECLNQYDIDVYLVLLRKGANYPFREKKELAEYLLSLPLDRQEMYLECERNMCYIAPKIAPALSFDASALDELLTARNLTFSERLIALIEKRTNKPSEIYKKANIDRKLYYKIRQDKEYHPSKMTILAFAAALELPLDETDELLESAGYAFSNSSRADIIIQYYFDNNIYDIYTINDALFYYGEALLGSC